MFGVPVKVLPPVKTIQTSIATKSWMWFMSVSLLKYPISSSLVHVYFLETKSRLILVQRSSALLNIWLYAFRTRSSFSFSAPQIYKSHRQTNSSTSYEERCEAPWYSLESNEGYWGLCLSKVAWHSQQGPALHFHLLCENDDGRPENQSAFHS